MPELPEVETMRRGILSIVGAEIRDVCLEPCERKPILIEPKMPTLRKRAVGKTVASVDRLGKRVLVRLDSQDAIVFEPRMTGLILVADPPSVEHLRVRVELAGCDLDRFWYWDRRGLGSCRLLTRRQVETKLGGANLGPDALAISWEDLRDRFKSGKRAIKPALLDQRVVAGVGNLYASELLHQAKVHPEKTLEQLSNAQWRRIHAAMVEILETAIRYEGSTLSDGTYRNSLNESGGYQNQHRVYDREGTRCTQCERGKIRRIVQTGRSTFFCAVCQRK